MRSIHGSIAGSVDRQNLLDHQLMQLVTTRQAIHNTVVEFIVEVMWRKAVQESPDNTLLDDLVLWLNKKRLKNTISLDQYDKIRRAYNLSGFSSTLELAGAVEDCLRTSMGLDDRRIVVEAESWHNEPDLIFHVR